MTGCARPYLGAAFNWERLNKLHKEVLDEDGIVAELTPLFADYSRNRQPLEYFGDFVVCRGYVQPTSTFTSN
jgi:sulfite reductase (NADPH) hemoprotein beta-component